MVDYSKWNNIEISDDEDDTHPNIDTPSLFLWRHKARLERMEERKKEIETFEKKKRENEKKYSEVQQKLLEAEKSQVENLVELQKALRELEMEKHSINQIAEDLKKKEKKTPWNVDTISKPGFSKSVINTRPKDENLTEKKKEAGMNAFIEEHSKEIKHYGMLHKYDDSRAYLKSHDYLICEATAIYLVTWCLNLVVKQKHDLMEHVAHQIICINYILELAKQLDRDPRACSDMFFATIQGKEPEYRTVFKEELRQMRESIVKYAGEKLEEAVKEVEEEKQKSLGTGGSNPDEVFKSLPHELQQCFKIQDIALLQETISKMNEEDVLYHMKRCIDSGLWIPHAKKTKEETESVPTGT